MKNSMKLIRVGLFSILLLLFSAYLIVEYVDNIKLRLIIFIILFIATVIAAVILLRSPKCAVSRIIILDILNIVIFVGLLGTFGRELMAINEVRNAFEGNNGFVSAYSKSIGDKGYEDIGSAVEDAIESRKKTTNQNELEEIYRVQTGDKIFIYFKESENIIEFEFFKQDDLYYSYGSKLLMYYGAGSSDGYTVEETIRKDIANTMWRGVESNEVGAPAWGVSIDEQISSMTINSMKVDDVIQIDEKDGKKYYFWITTNTGEIETIEDVKGAVIQL
ncbi:MAG: hypothetical protein HDR00_09245 [Lachnospiraceae bacterium]|nr:hypothetical protein [Lachnospiraceae bacterium]